MTWWWLVRVLATNSKLHINEFIDTFRRATPEERVVMGASGPTDNGRLEGLVAGVVSALYREANMEAPEWLRTVHSLDPYFCFRSSSFALRVRLMLESPPPFRNRNVFVPENYMSRA